LSKIGFIGDPSTTGVQKVLKEGWFKKALDKALDILGEKG